MTTLDLINQIEAGKTRDMEATFQEVMQSKMEDAIEVRRMEISQSMFTESEEKYVYPSYADRPEARKLHESSDWETRHDEFTKAGKEATHEHISKTLTDLAAAKNKSSGKRGVLNSLIGSKSNGDLARNAFAAETLHKNITANKNATHGTDARKELGQHMTYAKGVIQHANESEVIDEGRPQSMASALDRALSRPEPGSKLAHRIKSHNAAIKIGSTFGVLDKAPSGHRFNKAGSIVLGESEEIDEGAVPAHMRGKQKPYVSSDGKGAYEVLGNTGQSKATFSRYEHGENAKAAAIAHLNKHYDAYMAEDVELDEAATPPSHTIEAQGIRGMKGTAWRKTFKNHDHLAKWADENDSVEVHGTRDLESAKKVNLNASVKESVTPLKGHDGNSNVHLPNGSTSNNTY